MFDDKTDKIEYSTYNKRKILSGIKVHLNNGKDIFFLPSDMKKDYKSRDISSVRITNRNELKKIISNDKPEKEHKYIIIKKEKNTYNFYHIDHIFRVIKN